MASIKRDNLFLLPKRHGLSRSENEFSRKKIKRWVDDLPLGNIARVSHELYGKLERLNRINIPPLDRFEILQLLQTPLSFILDTLKRDCTKGATPLSTKSRLIADMRLEIMIQIVIAYKVVLAQFHDDSITGFLLHRNTRSEALRNALYYLGEILLHSYIIYQPSLNYVWKELHGIYYYSVSNELHLGKQIVTDKGRSERLNIDDLYKQILLLALANPNALLRGEVEKVCAALAQWITSVELVSVKDPVWAKSFFLIDAQIDAMPCAPNLCQKDKIDIGWALITDNLVKLLEEEAKAEEAAHQQSKKLRPADAVSDRLLNKLKSAWTQEIRSREVRSHTSGLVELVCGLEPLYLLHGGERLSNANEMAPEPRPFSSNSGYTHIGSVALDNDEVLIEVDPGVLQGRNTDKDTAALPEIQNISVGRKECITTNKSENGYYLNWPENGENGTHVGELVGVSPMNNKDSGVDVNLGVIRWMHVERPGFIGMGIELLNGFAEPIILQRKRKGGSQAESMKGFLQHESGGSVSLITPPFYVDEEDRFRVVTQGERRPVELMHIIESTDSFVRFQFEHFAGMH